MLSKVLEYQLDAAAFVALSVGMMFAVVMRLRNHYQIAGLSRSTFFAMLLTIIAGIVAAKFAGAQERNRLRGMLEGIAPTYAQELELMAHTNITPNTAADDPHYLALIEAEKRWLHVNPTVNDIYTLRQLPNGKIIFLVDSETDYNGDGLFDDDREKRTAIGEEYEPTDNMLQAFRDGKPIFDDIPTTDRWGTTVSAYVPMHDNAGHLDAVLGVDYDASTWTGSILRNRAAAFGFASVIVVILISSAAVVKVTREELSRRAIAEFQKQQLQEKLLATSRKAGMADVATGVLHNVGNVLNSVNVSVRMVSEKLESSKVSNLGRAAALLQQHSADLPGFFQNDPKAPKIPQYLSELAGVLATDQQGMLSELSLLEKSVEHIKQIVASQQEMAKSVDQNETFFIDELIDDAVRIAGLSIKAEGIEIVRQYDAHVALHADKHRVLQILVNLISNAKKAVSQDSVATRRIDLQVNQTASDGRKIVSVRVIDSGIGISREQMPQIFRHGFTTASDGHGFGLHTASNDAKRMGGYLRVDSGGVGLGATFTLELPVRDAEVSVS